MTVESMASPGVLKHRPVLDSDAPDKLGRKKGGNRRRESSALPSSRALLPRALPSAPTCCPLPRALPSAPACCPPPVRSSPARASFCSCALPSSRVLFSRALPPSAPVRCPLLQRALSSALLCALPSALNRAPSSLVRQLPPLLVDGKRIPLALCSRTTLLLCSRTALLLVPGYASSALVNCV
jgi:hypothetical protein